MNCPKCSTHLVADANFCHQCGFCVAVDEVAAGDSAQDSLLATDPASAASDAVETRGDFQEFGTNESPHVATATVHSAMRNGDIERDVWDGRYSPKAMIASFAALVLVTIAGFAGIVVAAVRDTRWLLISLLLVLPVLWVLQLGRLAKRYFAAQYRLTDRRLFIERGIVHRHKDQLELARVDDVRIRQNVLHRFLDVGSIEILPRDRNLRRVVMVGIQNADEVAETIRSLARERQPQPSVTAT